MRTRVILRKEEQLFSVLCQTFSTKIKETQILLRVILGFKIVFSRYFQFTFFFNYFYSIKSKFIQLDVKNLNFLILGLEKEIILKKVNKII